MARWRTALWLGLWLPALAAAVEQPLDARVRVQPVCGVQLRDLSVAEYVNASLRCVRGTRYGVQLSASASFDARQGGGRLLQAPAVRYVPTVSGAVLTSGGLAETLPLPLRRPEVAPQRFLFLFIYP